MGATRLGTLGAVGQRVPERLRRLVPRAFREQIRARVGPYAPWEAGYRTADAGGNGAYVTGPPHFVGIGAQKAGTTWWYDLLSTHPEVYRHPTLHKERHFFAPYALAAFDDDAVRAYAETFPRPDGDLLVGEWTPDYLYQPWVPPLLRQAAPDARLLVIVRDPVDRFVSGLAHSGLGPTTHIGSLAAEAVERGRYAASLRRWLAEFPAEQLLILQYERCVADPGPELRRTYAHVGVDPDFVPGQLRGPERPTSSPKPLLDAEARRRLVAVYRDDVVELAALVADLDLTLWPDFAS